MSHPASPLAVLRRLRRSPGFALLAVATLALAIGADVAVFSLVNTILLRPLPYAEADRLVGLWHTAPGLAMDEMPQSPATFVRYRDHATALESIAVYQERELALTGEDEPEQVTGAAVSASLFDVLRTVPAEGRLLRPGDELPGATPVVLVGDSLWRRRYGSDPDLVGKTVLVDGIAREVIAVTPPGFAFPEPETELWIPVALDPARLPLGVFSYRAVGRLRPGVETTTAAAELNQLLGDLTVTFPGDPAAAVLTNAGFEAYVHDLRDDVIGDIAPALWILLGAVGLIFLVGCANVANLFLVRADGRRHEIAVRSALGESHGRLVGSLLLESLLLGAAGGVAGLGLAVAAVRLVARLGAGSLPRLAEHSVDGRVLLFTLAVALAAGLLLGLAPAWRAVPKNAGIDLAEAGYRTVGHRRRHRLLRVLVATQVALATVLLVGSGLASLSFRRLAQVDPGFQSDGLLTFRVALPEREYREPARVADFHQRLAERLRSLPGATDAGGASWLPLTAFGRGAGHTLEDFPLQRGDVPPVFYTERVTPGYFSTFGIPIVEGADFTVDEHAHGRRVVIVSETIAKKFWPSQSAVGKRILPGSVGPGDGGETLWYTVVGVAGDVRDTRLQDAPRELVYYPARMETGEHGGNPPERRMGYAMRVASGDPTALAGAVRAAVAELDPNLPIADLEPMQAKMRRATARLEFSMVLLLLAAGAALLLGCVGLYGVVSYAMRQRLQEMAVRMALGARPGDIRGMVLSDGLRIGAVGIGAGLAGSVALTRLMKAVLYQVSPLDPLVFTAATALPFAVFLLSTFLPAARAAAVDPATVLRRD